MAVAGAMIGGERGRDRGPRPERGERPDRRNDNRLYASSQAPQRDKRDREPDPNSPFAKLAALKEQLAANRKD